MMMCAEFECLWLQDGTTPTPDNMNDLLSVIRYSDIYIRFKGSSVTSLMWQEMDSDHYNILYLTNTFAAPDIPSISDDTSMVPSVDPYFPYNSMRSALSKIPLVVPDPYSNSMGIATYATYNLDGASEEAIRVEHHKITPKLGEKYTRQKMWSHILNNKQDQKDLKRYYSNANNWRKVKENWESTISVSQLNFTIKNSYVPPDKSDPYACNTANLEDGYICKILYINIATGNNRQWYNALEQYHKRGPKGKGLITDGQG